MITETYRGIRLKAIAGRKSKWGTVDYYVNGKKWGGSWLGRDEQKAISEMKLYVDAAALRPGSSPEFEPKAGA